MVIMKFQKNVEVVPQQDGCSNRRKRAQPAIAGAVNWPVIRSTDASHQLCYTYALCIPIFACCAWMLTFNAQPYCVSLKCGERLCNFLFRCYSLLGLTSC
jgi:hypothetical protein